jgi:hypothetical protein
LDYENAFDGKKPSLLSRFEDGLKQQRLKVRGFFRIAGTASFEPINRTLARALYHAIKRANKNAADSTALRQIASELPDFLERDYLEASKLADFFDKAGKAFGAPIILIIDEFRKSLEYMSRFPGNGDMFILQTLAEMKGINIWVCLHQAFEEYAAGLPEKQRRDWGKVQGRFEDIVFVEPPNQMLRFISKTLVYNDGKAGFPEKIEKWGHFFHQEAARRELPKIQALDLKSLSSFYPLHPMTAVLLPDLCARFAQNDRTLFSFLCGGEPNALPAFLESQLVDPISEKLPVFGPDLLYDYFISSANGISMTRPESSRWIEIRDMVDQAGTLPELEQKLLKIIGLMNLISGPHGVAASANRIAFALSSPESRPDISQILSELIKKGMLIYRKYADEYRLWEGSDFDVREAISHQRAILASQPLLKILEKTVPLTPLTASRHSYETGTLRHFERRWTDESGVSETPDVSPLADGIVLYAFGNKYS